MKNFEKYKTAEERTKSFNIFCGNRQCSTCEIRQKDIACRFAWLDVEAEEEEEEELKHCPFCGSTHIEIYDDYPKISHTYKFMCKDCEAEAVINAQSKEEK